MRSPRLTAFLVATFAANCALAQVAGQEEDPTQSATGVNPTPQVINVATTPIPQLNTLAREALEAGRFSEATGLVQEVLRRDRNNLEGLRIAGEIGWEAGQLEAARANWLRVRSIQSNDFVANYGLGRIYLNSNVPRSAMQFLETALPVAPPDKRADVLVNLARAYRASGMSRQARDTVDEALKLAPRDFIAWQLRVLLRTETATTPSDFEQALNDADRVIQLGKDFIENEGVTLAHTQQLYRAYETKLETLREFRNVLFRQNPDGTLSNAVLPGREQTAGRVLSLVVDILMRQRDLRSAMENYEILPFAERAVEYDGGTSPQSLMDLGALQAATGDIEAAIETYRRAEQLAPDNEEVQAALRMLTARAGPTPAGN